MSRLSTRLKVYQDLNVVMFIVMALFLAVVSFATYQRNIIWSDGITFWTDVANKSPKKARPHNNLGSALINAGRYDEAITALRLSLEADPWYVESHLNLGISHIKKGRFDEALPELKEVLRINEILTAGHYGAVMVPRYEFEAHANLGNIYSEKGMFEDAVLHYKEALKHIPDDVSTHFNLAVTYKRQGRLDEARAEFEEVLKLDPEDEGARWNIRMLEKMLDGR